MGEISDITIIRTCRRQFDQLVASFNWKNYSVFAVGMLLLNSQVNFAGIQSIYVICFTVNKKEKNQIKYAH